ncbi:MAG: hypothetical protein ACOYXM_15840 [Actinomycetota bacterium]
MRLGGHLKARLAAVFAAALVLSAGAVGFAQAEPGPNGHNNHGLCTAYYNGSPNGQEHKRKAGPFVALEEAADQAGDGDGTATAEEVASFCDGLVGGRAGR